MRRGDALIYAGRIRFGELLGVPDLPRREGGAYIAGDIKSGAGVEGSENLAKRKQHYAVQLALYTDIVRKCTEWPTHDYSLKTLARYLGFDWKDTDLSGAPSIEWFHHWTDTGDEAIRQRILAYNEDDCRATRVLRDALQSMPVA